MGNSSRRGGRHIREVASAIVEEQATLVRRGDDDIWSAVAIDIPNCETIGGVDTCWHVRARGIHKGGPERTRREDAGSKHEREDHHIDDTGPPIMAEML